MAATPQTQAIDVVNGLIVSAQRIMADYLLLKQLQQQWTDDGVATLIAAMGTVSLNTDGTLGPADGEPNVDHPIDLSKYTTLIRAISSTQIGQIKSITDGFVGYVDGQVVSQQAGARAILNIAVGG